MLIHSRFLINAANHSNRKDKSALVIVTYIARIIFYSLKIEILSFIKILVLLNNTGLLK